MRTTSNSPSSSAAAAAGAGASAGAATAAAAAALVSSGTKIAKMISAFFCGDIHSPAVSCRSPRQ